LRLNPTGLSRCTGCGSAQEEASPGSSAPSAAGVSFVADGIAAADVGGQSVSATYTRPDASSGNAQPRRASSFEATAGAPLTREAKHAKRYPGVCTPPLRAPDQGIGNYGFRLAPALSVGIATQAVAGVGPAGLVFSQEGGMLFTRDGAQPYLTLGGDGKMGGLAAGAGATSPVTGVGFAGGVALNVTLSLDRASVPGASETLGDLVGAWKFAGERSVGSLTSKPLGYFGMSVSAFPPAVTLSVGPQAYLFVGSIRQLTSVAP